MLGVRVGVFALALVVAGCTRANPEYCDAVRPCGDGFSCAADSHTCVAGDDCAAGACLCDGPADCPATLADCVDGACTACSEGDAGDAACAANAPATPVCAGGACVECTANADCAGFGDESPHCDGASHACGACRDDAECSAGVCDETAGACLAADALLHVADGGVDGGACTLEAPCATVAGALAQVAAGRTTVVVHQRGAPYVESIVLDGKDYEVTAVAVIGAVGERPEFIAEPDTAGVIATDPGVAFRLERIALRDGSRAGVSCRGASVTAVDLRISRFAGIGVDAADACDLTLRRSEVLDNDGGGVSLISGTTFSLENDLLALNGFDAGSVRGGLVIEEATGTVEFCTVADNQVNSGGRSPGIDCLGDLALANNIVWSNGAGDDNVGGECSHAFSLIGTLPGDLDGGDNLDSDPLFTRDTRYQLTVDSPAIDAADPAAILAVDRDGDPRPIGVGRDLGADEFVAR